VKAIDFALPECSSSNKKKSSFKHSDKDFAAFRELLRTPGGDSHLSEVDLSGNISKSTKKKKNPRLIASSDEDDDLYKP